MEQKHRKPGCRICKKAATVLKPLFRCCHCYHYYHAACHSPRPREDEAKTWACARCEKRISDTRYDERTLRASSVPHMTRSSEATSSTTAAAKPSVIRPAGSMAHSSRASSISSQGAAAGSAPVNGSIRCSAPRCQAPITSDQVFCARHQVDFFPSRGSAPAPARPVSASAPPAQNPPLQPQPQPQVKSPMASHRSAKSASVERQGQPTARKNKTLAENDKDRPITMRKSVAKSFNSFSPGQTSTKPAAMSPPASASPTLHSSAPPISVLAPPPLLDGEPPKKKPRTTPTSADSSAPAPNGTGSASLASTANFAGARIERPAPAPQKVAPRTSSASPAARLGGPKTSVLNLSGNRTSKKPVRKMAPPISTFQFSSSSSEARSQPVVDQPEPGVRWNGVAITTESPEKNRPIIPKTGVNEYWALGEPGTGGFERKTLPTAQVPQSRLTPQLSNGLHVDPPRAPEKNNADAPCNTKQTPQNPTDLQWKLPVMPDIPSQRPPSQAGKTAKPKTKASKSPAPLEKPIFPPPPPRKIIDETAFDALIYQQQGAATPPPEVCLPASPAGSVKANKKAAPLPLDEPFYADIDPRVHWPQPRSEAWVNSKRVDIASRGNRKANFGKAAQRMKEHKRREPALPVEEMAPEKVLRDPAWLKIWKRLHEGETERESREGTAVETVPVKPRKGRKPGLKKQASSNASASGNGLGDAVMNGQVNGCTTAIGLNGNGANGLGTAV